MEWIPHPSAILVVHGIGNQEPLQTLDSFASGILSELRRRGGPTLSVKQCVSPLGADAGVIRSFLRLEPTTGGHPLDIFEYYWADLPQDKASVDLLQKWVQGAAAGAASFYAENKTLGAKYHDHSSFFRADGSLVYWKYHLFLQGVASAIPLTTSFLRWILLWVRRIPGLGWLLGSAASWFETNFLDVLVNVVGDVVIFNNVGARSQFLEVRRRILAGCVQALQTLVEPQPGMGQKEAPTEWDANSWRYGRVMVAGHSLGTQVTFDALNQLNHMAALKLLRGVDAEGRFRDSYGLQVGVFGSGSLSELIGGYITFGSPLDKIAFFFREAAPKTEILRRQMIANLRCFKQRPWDLGRDGVEVPPPLPRLLDEVPWVNYWDPHDAVSGALDYYAPIENRVCGFPVKFGTPSKVALILGWVIWCVAFLAALVFWGRVVWKVDFIDLETFAVADFVRNHAIHAVALGVFLVGTLALIASSAIYFAGNFTHSRYWSDPLSPLYRDLLDQFLLPPKVPRMAELRSPVSTPSR